MSSTVPSSEVQRNFGRIHDLAMREPVEITNHGRTTAYLVSADTFRKMWESYRRTFMVSELSDEEVTLLQQARVPEELDWDPGQAGETSAKSR